MQITAGTIRLLLPALALIILQSCSTQQKLTKTANKTVLGDSALDHAHVGISIFEPSTGKFLYNYNESRYFVPASNMKILTCYAAMKYLGDSLAGIRYAKTADRILLQPTGDPTLLHADYKNQPVVRFLQSATVPLEIEDQNWKTDAFGSGWSWADYNFYYSAERSPLPVYGNIVTWTQERDTSNDVQSPFIYSNPEVNWKVRFDVDTASKAFYVKREKDQNVFLITEGREAKKQQEVPFVTNGIESALELLKDTLGLEVRKSDRTSTGLKFETIHSQPLDSVLKPMMHRSDNLFAEQLLLMVANERFGKMDESLIIDTFLKTELRELPDRPGWADGSGLSRFNLFSPRDFVLILGQMQKEFGIERLKNIFPTGGKGTLSNYYKADSGYFYAKTGSLNGVIALSGFLYTKNNRLLTVSVLINNYRGSGTTARRAVEAFLVRLRQEY
ncbi:MAG: D-alanyl-D-alanine carboxypeptidase/D-alanyl-D-alanine-endopeptidase [Chitinophagaceae bacterium]|nr:D-alanyl-D-alanine carboxypeptidase/D-alanyl-D-alanine-endopeptidase [Chitinophagaceae bacterium]